LTLGLGLKIIDKEISLKYEVDEVYYLTKSKTDDEKKIKIFKLDNKDREIRFQINCLIIASIITFSFATGLAIKQGKILRN
jgi:hypothetical protein